MTQIIPTIEVVGEIIDDEEIKTQTFLPDDVYVIGNYPIPDEIITFKKKQDLDDYLAKYQTGITKTGDFDDDLLKFYYRVLVSKDSFVVAGSSTRQTLTNGIKTLTLVNTATHNDPLTEFTAVPLTPDVLKHVLYDILIAEEGIDLLSIASPLNDYDKTSSGLLLTAPELLKVFGDEQIKKKNFIQSQFCLEGKDGTGVLAPTVADSVSQFLDVAHKFGQPESVSRNGDTLPTTENGGSGAIIVQQLKPSKDYEIDTKDNADKLYSIRQVNAIITGLIGGRNISESIVHQILPCFQSVALNSVFDFKAPSDIDPNCGDGYKLTNAGLTLFKNGSRAKEDCFIVNSLSPGLFRSTDSLCPKQGEKTTEANLRLNICHLMTRNVLINEMKLSSFLGRKRILSAYDDLNHEIVDALSRAQSAEVIADYQVKVAKSKIDPETVNVNLTLVVYGLITRIVLAVKLTMDGITE